MFKHMKSIKQDESKMKSVNEILQEGFVREKKMAKMLKQTRQLLDEIDAMTFEKVKPLGNSYYVPIQKKYKDRVVRILILKEEKKKKKS